MKLIDRHHVEGTQPRISIGHRSYRRGSGPSGVCRTWHAEWCMGGKQYARTLKTTDFAAAIRAAHALCQRLIDRTDGGYPRRLTVDAMRAKYLEVLTNRGRAPRTIAKYTYVLREFGDWWRQRGDRSAVGLVEGDLWEYQAFLCKAGKSPKSICDRLTLVRQLFKWAASKGKLLAADPFADATVVEPPPTPQPCFTPEQVEQLLSAASQHELGPFTMMAYTGMRVGEVAALQWEDLLLHRGTSGFIRVRLGGSNGTTKGRRPRLIPIHPKLRDLLDGLSRSHKTVFTRPRSSRCPNGDRPLNPRQLLGAIKRLCRRCGFPDWRAYKVHTWRHAFASMCARSQISYRYALGWMGHRRSEILDLYITLYDTAAEGAIRTINYDPQTRAEGSHERNDAAGGRESEPRATRDEFPDL